ncbi:MAG: hypothetical protein HY801_02730 [Candidatus Lindowbacteria bacterium]|nr:hypothetical protein [Candidatus Lindowbacteria bacterium]
MLTQCVRCHKSIDTVQGYKFSPTEYLCMSCYDAYKAERTARLKKEHKNPLIDRVAPVASEMRSQLAKVQPPAAPVAQPQPKTEPAPEPAKPVPPAAERPQAPPSPQAAPAGDMCDVCKKPLSAFKVPLKGGKKVCMDCNNILRDVAKSLILNVQCPHCGKEIQLSKE